jgi:DNA polymerase III epsilon subunit-like protein
MVQDLSQMPERLDLRVTPLTAPRSSLAICLDTETTDLSPNRTMRDDRRPRIIEFYGCLVDLDCDQPPLEELELLIDPLIPLPEKIVKITHIAPEMLLGKPCFKDVAVQIRNFLQDAPLIIAHNASFDKEVLDIELERARVPIKWPPVLCTVEETIFLKGMRLTLSNLHEHLFGEKFKDAHRARSDVMALVRVARELRRRGLL